MSKKTRIDHTEEYVRQLETELIGFSVGVDNVEKYLPLMKPTQIRTMIYNLLSSDKWRTKISFQDYAKIMEVFMDRIKKSTTPTETEILM